MKNFEWDVFISHASEDKESFVEEFVVDLRKYNLKVWFDKFTLRAGDCLSESIDAGLKSSRFGIVVLSRAFFAKNWPRMELNALFARQSNGPKVILPIWHQITREDVLSYSPLIADIKAPDTIEGSPAIAKELARVIRPDAFDFSTSRTDAQNAGARMHQQLKKKFPHLDARITIGGPLPVDLIATSTTQNERPIIASGINANIRFDFFAADGSVSDQDALSASLALTADGWRKIKDAQKNAEQIELGPEEIIDFSWELYDFISETSGILPSKIVIGPAKSPPKRFRFRLRFRLGVEQEEFSYVEFDVVSAAEGKATLRSVAPEMPLHLVLTFDLVGGQRNIDASYSYPGHEIRKVYKAHRALQFMMQGGDLEITDLETDQTLPILRSELKAWSASEGEIYVDKLIRALYEVATGFRENIKWIREGSRQDSIYIQILREIVRTGTVSLPAEEIEMDIRLIPGASVENILKPGFIFSINSSAPPAFATVFGKTFDVGPYSIVIQPSKIEMLPENSEDGSRRLRVGLAGPMVYKFEKFFPPTPDPASA